MPQTIHRGIKSLIDEANAEIETVSAVEAIKAAQSDEVVIVDIRDPREIERDGKIPGAFSCTRGMLSSGSIRPVPMPSRSFRRTRNSSFIAPGGMRSALAAKTAQDMGLKPVAHICGRLCRLARRRRADREMGTEEELIRAIVTRGLDPRVHLFKKDGWPDQVRP